MSSATTTETSATAISNNNLVANNDKYSLNNKESLVVSRVTDTGWGGSKVFNYGVLNNDIYNKSSNVTVYLVSDVGNGGLNLNADGTFTYSLNKGFSGEDQFTYKFCTPSAECSNIATSTIAIKNFAPKAADDNYQMRQDTILNVNATIGVLKNDADKNNNKLSAELITNVQHGKLDFQADGALEYKPNTGYFGTDTFSYKAYDGLEYSSPANAYITIKQNHQPQAVDDQYKITQGETLNANRIIDKTGVGGFVLGIYGVLNNDKDDDGDSLVAHLHHTPKHGTLEFYPNGTFTYTHNNNDQSDDSFTYFAYDGLLVSQVATAYIVVNSSPDEL